MSLITKFIKKNMMVSAAFGIAIISMLFVKPDAVYFNYFDYKTLSTLFFMLMIIAGLSNSNFFQFISHKIISKIKNLRTLIFILIVITFIGSIIIANDMALITFLPLGYFVIYDSGNKKYMAFTFIMQNIAANLGGMLTPFGNPQNLFLYTYYQIPFIEFIEIMLPYFLLSIIFMYIMTVLFVDRKYSHVAINHYEFNVKESTKYIMLFVIFILILTDIIPYIWGYLIPIYLFIDNRFKILSLVDYGLLLTFIFFFIITGNIARIEIINEVLSEINQSTIFYLGVLSTQFISNVPTAILLSKFTTNYQGLLVAVNVGGVGTIIASLASLITYKEYVKREPTKAKSYLYLFSLINFIFLGALILLYYIFNQ